MGPPPKRPESNSSFATREYPPFTPSDEYPRAWTVDERRWADMIYVFAGIITLICMATLVVLALLALLKMSWELLVAMLIPGAVLFGMLAWCMIVDDLMRQPGPKAKKRSQ